MIRGNEKMGSEKNETMNIRTFFKSSICFIVKENILVAGRM